MRVVTDKQSSTVFTEEFWRNWKLEFIAAHNEKIVKEKKRLLSIDAPLLKAAK